MRKRKVLFPGRPYMMAVSLMVLMPLLLSTAFGQLPQAQWLLAIKGPNESPAGELVVLTAGQIAENVTEQTVAVFCEPDGCRIDTSTVAMPDTSKLQFRWQVLPTEAATDAFYVCDDGRTLVFASRQVGCYHFVLAASDGENLQIVTHTLLNIGENPKPIPLPTPEPEPMPSPEPQHEFVSLYDWASQKTESLVRSDYFVREKAALAESLAEITMRIRHDEIKTSERARVELRVLTRRKLDAVSRRSTLAWQGWETELARRLSQLEQDGKLETLEQLCDVFDAIADGLLGR